jgi:TorA maturation chaperone TorD
MAFFRETDSQGKPDNELTAEHSRLFVLPSGVIPHESFYLGERKRLGGQVTAGVCRYYEKAGAQLTEKCLDLPDHIGMELEFMHFLCDIEEQLRQEPDLAGLETCLEFQEGFLSEHLLRWYKPLCERIIEEARLGIYRSLARLTVEFLEAEREFVSELTVEVNPDRRQACDSTA